MRNVLDGNLNRSLKTDIKLYLIADKTLQESSQLSGLSSRVFHPPEFLTIC